MLFICPCEKFLCLFRLANNFDYLRAVLIGFNYPIFEQLILWTDELAALQKILLNLYRNRHQYLQERATSLQQRREATVITPRCFRLVVSIKLVSTMQTRESYETISK